MAYVETDEIDDGYFPIAVVDYIPERYTLKYQVETRPIFSWVADCRTEQQQRFLERNIYKINELFVDLAKSEGYLKENKIKRKIDEILRTKLGR